MRNMFRILLAGITILTTTSLTLAAQEAPVLEEVEIRGLDDEDRIQDRYIVVFKEDAAASAAQESAITTAMAHGGAVHYEYSTALNGFAAVLPPAALAALRQNPNIDYIQTDGWAYPGAIQSPVPSWGLDRIDQRDRPFSGTYTYNRTGRGVHAYVIDSGTRATHTEFGKRVTLDYDAVNDGQNGNDCQGHGTHVAGTLGGKSYGVAKEVRIHTVRVLNCANRGAWSTIIAGVDWVAANYQKPAVVNMSIQGNKYDPLNTAVTNLVNKGISVVAAAGNFNKDACEYSPGSTPDAITVGAISWDDWRWVYSNYGSCIDIFAPGVGITSASHVNDRGTEIMNGTSMAAPHVAGVVALYLQDNPNATPSEVANYITNNATTGKIINLNGSPDRLLYLPTTTTPTSCDEPTWRRNVLYEEEDEVSHNGREWLLRATKSLNEEPGQSGSWTDLGVCG